MASITNKGSYSKYVVVATLQYEKMCSCREGAVAAKVQLRCTRPHTCTDWGLVMDAQGRGQDLAAIERCRV